MECGKPNCTITGNERMVSCWLCTNIFHMKCTYLKARDADALLDKNKSLTWTCPRCKNIGVEFYNFFKNSRAEYDEINKDLIRLSQRLNKYGETFTNYSNLENFAKTSQPSLQINKSFDSSKTTLPVPTSSVQNNAQAQLNLIEIDALSPLPSTSTQSFLSNESIITTPQLLPRPSIIVNGVSNSSETNSIDSQQVSSHQPQLTRQTVNNFTSRPPSTHATAPKSPHISPKKTIFVTRFAADTVAEDVVSYIESKITNDIVNDIKVYKMNTRNRVSFKVIVPNELFDTIVNREFWPKNTLVREFIYRDEDNVRLPKAANKDNSKN